MRLLGTSSQSRDSTTNTYNNVTIHKTATWNFIAAKASNLARCF